MDAYKEELPAVATLIDDILGKGVLAGMAVSGTVVPFLPRSGDYEF